MRDPKRIREFCAQLAEIWETQCPDWRFGQLISNVFSGDPFYLEEDAAMKMIRDYFKLDNKEETER